MPQHPSWRHRRLRAAGLALLLALMAEPTWAMGPQTVIKGIDIVGVPAAQVAELLKLLGIKEGMQVPYARLEETVVTPAQTRLERTGRYQIVSVRPTTFIGGQDDGATYLSVSVVDRLAASKLLAVPKEARELPEALERFFTERARGMGAFRDTLYPMDHDRLEELAETYWAELTACLHGAADPQVRRKAAQAIAFHPNSLTARKTLQDALRDPDAGVRRDAARALQPLVERQIGRSEIPLEPYLALIRFPEPSDRLAATSLLIKLSKVPANRPLILREAGSALLAMAKMKHPGERTLALEALQVLKGASAPESWDTYRNWFEKTTAQRFSP